MRIFETYAKENILREFWNQLQEELLTEENSALNDLLERANELVFNKFNIRPNDKVYFIAGSARLYLYPKLREAFDLKGEIGDLDIVIPNKELWINAGLEGNWNRNGIYRPTQDGSIEVFNVWDPSKAGEEFADTKVRSTNAILIDANQINGYYFMSLGDIIDYKMSLNREKEQEVVNLITQYQQSNYEDRKTFLRKIAKLIGLNKTKEFLGIVGQ